MNGKLSLSVVQLDYRQHAEPLTFAKIREDLDELFGNYDKSPERIVLWEHQADWLVKTERAGKPLESSTEYIFVFQRRKPVASHTVEFVYGIPVEVWS